MKLKELRKRANAARNQPDFCVTDPCSRHVQLMAEGLLKKGYPMLQEEPEHCAESLLATVAMLWELRAELHKLNSPNPS